MAPLVFSDAPGRAEGLEAAVNGTIDPWQVFSTGWLSSVRVADRSDMAINAGLGWLGISAGSNIDEFGAVGLDRHRWTDDWTQSPL